jgi:hypothetical protein
MYKRNQAGSPHSGLQAENTSIHFPLDSSITAFSSFIQLVRTTFFHSDNSIINSRF